MNAQDKFTVSISFDVDRVTGGPEKEGNISSFVITYNKMDYGDVVALEKLVVDRLVSSLVEAGLEAAAAMGVELPLQNKAISSNRK